MKNYLSILAFVIVSLVFAHYRVSHSDLVSNKPLKVTTWDAFGYYMYLPGKVIYDDITKYEWLDEIQAEYRVTGDGFYQARLAENGNYVGKYLVGVVIMELPFFLLGHAIAVNSHYKADGFSPPYQYSIAFGAVFYFILSFFLLRIILLKFYSDEAVAVSLLLLGLATNLIQYIAIDSAQSHAFIFPLYVLILYFTIQWHKQPEIKWASLIGLTIGLATICRPTEAIMLFIPLLWGMQDKESKKRKWALVKQNSNHVFWVMAFGLVGIIPQLIYWKVVSGSLVYNVGSKWFFLNPFFRVIFGFENGWMVYTPITIFFVLGFFFIKKFPFRRSVVTFCLLNIWIVIAWSDWKYGATYSTRALVQSYPVFALAFAGIVENIIAKKWRIPFLIVGVYLVFVNLFQIEQYYDTVLHYRDMNRAYYSRIYLNNSPTPLDMSLLDTDEVLDSESGYSVMEKATLDSVLELSGIASSSLPILSLAPSEDLVVSTNERWLNIKASIMVSEGFSASYLKCKIESESGSKEKRIRLFSPISQAGKMSEYEFYAKVPETFGRFEAKIFLESEANLICTVQKLKVTYLNK